MPLQTQDGFSMRELAREIVHAFLAEVAAFVNERTDLQLIPGTRKGQEIPIPTAADIDRFWSHADQSNPDGCWIWKSAKTRAGYGVFSLGGRVIPAHRFARYLHSGPIPPSMMILHACDAPACVNPDHLRPGTAAENANDAVERWRFRQGEAHPASRLKREAVLAIFHSKASVRELMKQYDISATTIRKIRSGEAWRSVTSTGAGLTAPDTSPAENER